MNEDFRNLLSLLTLERLGIYNNVKPDEAKILYFDNDSEDEGTTLVELALLRLCLEVFSSHGPEEAGIQNQLHEMGCIINMAIDLSEVGQRIFLLRTENSYDLFWNIINRYSKSILEQYGLTETPIPSPFPFVDMLERYNFSVEHR